MWVSMGHPCKPGAAGVAHRHGMGDTTGMRPLELTRRGVLGTLAVIVVAGACFRLGVWQLDRRAERMARNQAIAERMDLPVVALDEAPADTAGLAYRRARVAGAIDDDRAIVLAGRSLNGAPGVHLLSPVRVRARAILVNRGWLPSADAATVDLDTVRLHGRVRAEGLLVPFPDVDVDTEPDRFRERWFRVDGDAIRAQYPYPVAPLYLIATDPVTPTDRGGADGSASGSTPEPTRAAPVPLEPPALDPGPHLSYAIQWFSFGTIFLVGWVVLLVRRPASDRDD